MAGELVLVTGGTGFLAGHCIARLLGAGYRVRASVRALARGSDVRAALQAAGIEPADDALSFAEADLSADGGWAEAAAGCDYVLHIASPFPSGVPKHEDEVIGPARDGALRVLRAARDAGARRVVLTSSFAAIGYGHPPTERAFTEEDWTDTGARNVGAYIKSKTLAERAAWDFIEREGGGLELASINPTGIFGPALSDDYSTSVGLIKQMLEGAMPGVPRITFGVVDVRDVADLHLRAMTDPAAKGERFLAVAGEPLSMAEAAALLRERLGAAGARVPTKVMPDWQIKALALVSPGMKPIIHDLGKVRRGSSDKARRLLGWAPRSREDALLATAESLVRHGVLLRLGERG
ncbi:MAG TPA: aldehyde reductase [Herpetosiphonaceae bacterium]